jgi:hypothetical protein
MLGHARTWHTLTAAAVLHLLDLQSATGMTADSGRHYGRVRAL